MANSFKLHSEYEPAGDQPQAISMLMDGLNQGMHKQTLLGATGTGKTFTMANVIAQIGKPTLVIAHNKTLAAQLAQEFQEFFPENAVHYFVSYYDYYQPEAYMPTTDTYIEKDASINEKIDRLRHASTQALLTRDDVIIVASVSCLYGLGSPEQYLHFHMLIQVGMTKSKRELMEHLIHIQYERTNADLKSGQFRAIGNKVEVMPISEEIMYSISFAGDTIERILKIDAVSSQILSEPENVFIFPAKHFMTSADARERAFKSIEHELSERLKELDAQGKILEHERLKRRTNYDLAMIREIGYTSGIENYSRHFSGKAPGEAPDTLISYFPRDAAGNPQFLTIIDESHVTVPQIRAMFAGDQARKETLVEFGFRLPSAKDNRPLKFEEFEKCVGQQVYVSATPTDYEKEQSSQIAEQIIRPTGLIDPAVDVRPITPTEDYPGQVQDFILEAEKEIARNGRVLAITLTKRMAEDLSAYLIEKGIRTKYIHSDIKTIERIEIITEFRKGAFECLVGVNLLREGLDMPEVTFIGILDADKEGFLRSETSLIQTIGRAARNVDGRVVLYADQVTGSMSRAMEETSRRRDKQLAYNAEHGITPKTIQKAIRDITSQLLSEHDKAVKLDLDTELARFDDLSDKQKETAIKKLIREKERQMNDAVKELDFESAALYRDEIKALGKMVEEK